MDTALQSTLDTLRDQRGHAELEVDALRVALASAEQRLAYIRGAIENIEALIGLAPSEQRAGEDVIADEGIVGDETLSLRDRAGDESPTTRDVVEHDRGDSDYRSFSDDARMRTRVPSTEWIADIVNNAGRVMTRNEVFDAFEGRHGFPQSWTSPRNSLGNAINRAADRGWIRRLDARHFAPRDYEPAGARSTPDTGGQ